MRRDCRGGYIKNLIYAVVALVVVLAVAAAARKQPGGHRIVRVQVIGCTDDNDQMVVGPSSVQECGNNRSYEIYLNLHDDGTVLWERP